MKTAPVPLREAKDAEIVRLRTERDAARKQRDDLLALFFKFSQDLRKVIT